MAKPCTPHPIAQRVQLFTLQTANVGGRGVLPSPFSGGSKGGSLWKENTPFEIPRERRGGLPPRPRTLPVCSSKSCTRCAIGCGVHGFAMNPCESLPLATAPYYREARVTVVGRQTACRMRHCWCLPHCGDWRWTVITANFYKMGRAAAGSRSRSNRIAGLNAALPRADIAFRRHKGHSRPLLAGDPISPQNVEITHALVRSYETTTRRFGSVPMENVVTLGVSWSAVWMMWRS